MMAVYVHSSINKIFVLCYRIEHQSQILDVQFALSDLHHDVFQERLAGKSTPCNAR